MSEYKERHENEIFTKVLKAGRRTYFFDVRETKAGDYYLTITESKKRFGDDGKFFYEKHKIFLYKEDFEKFVEGLNETIQHINQNSPSIASNNNGTDVNFEDLGN